MKKQTSKYERRRERGTAINPDKNFKWLIKLTLMPCINILCICLSACAANVGSFVCRQIVCIDTQRSQYTIQYKLTILMMGTMRSMRRKNAVEQPHKRNSLQMHKMFDVKQTHLFVCSLSLSPGLAVIWPFWCESLCKVHVYNLNYKLELRACERASKSACALARIQNSKIEWKIWTGTVSMCINTCECV